MEAHLDFSPELTVVSGASNTGKSHAVELIGFLLGSSPPEEIPESLGFTQCSLELELPSLSKVLRLERSTAGGHFMATELTDGVTSDPLILRADRSTKSNQSLSDHLLDYLGASGRVARKNDSGETSSITLSSLRHFCVVDENSIIKKQSPILSGQFTKPTEEISVFRYMISGVDDSGIIAAPKPKIHAAGRTARVGLLEELAADARTQLEEVEASLERLDPSTTTLAEVVAAIEEESAGLIAFQQSVATVDDQRRAVWKKLSPKKNRARMVAELLKRYDLLAQQYESDAARLGAVLEADDVLSDWTSEPVACPVCRRPWEVPGHEHDGDVEVWRTSVRSEIAKISALRSDLAGVRNEADEENNRLLTEVGVLEAEYHQLAREVEQQLGPRVAQLRERVSALTEIRSLIERRDALRTRIAELESRREKVSKERRPQADLSAALPLPALTASTRDLCLVIRSLLQDWEFPYAEDIVFAEGASDLVLDGRPRASFGKGLRAITHAAFTIGLMRYCLERSLPHLGFVVLDSPLITYKDPDPEDRGLVPDALKDRFFRSVSALEEAQQVVVFENVDPPADIDARLTHFSGTVGRGRQGFYPSARSE